MKNIQVCPSTLKTGFQTYCPSAIKNLFSGVKVSHLTDFTISDEDTIKKLNDNVGKLSLSGVQEKYSAIIREKKVILTPQGMQGTYIIKPAPTDRRIRNRKQLPANENLTMQIARQVYKINTAENGMLFFSDGEPAYLTKRFDVLPDGQKLAQEDFASLTGKNEATHGTNYKYTGTYEDIACKIKQYVKAWQIETARFYTLIIFNYLFANDDAHLKNFSLRQTIDGDYILTPAYDLVNTSLHIDEGDFALQDGLSKRIEKSDIYEKKGHPCQTDFIRFGLQIGLSHNIIAKIIKPFLNEQAKVYELITNSFLDEKLKRMYRKSYTERLDRFRRASS
ncbi:HipA domain-containing protein [Parabacteroides sp. ASD2025]|uniref:HipA domain-containing protein n=1 Tax=Parabacteroides sp. ASD2025 TaxID=3415987 RepID=UPI003CF21D1E